MEITYRKLIREVTDSKADHLHRLDELKVWMSREEKRYQTALQEQVDELNREISVKIGLIDGAASIAKNRADSINRHVTSNITKMKTSLRKASIPYQSFILRKPMKINDTDLNDTDSICNEMMRMEANISEGEAKFYIIMDVFDFYQMIKKNIPLEGAIYIGIIIFSVVFMLIRCG